jgi:hypothetical protein
MRVRPIVAGGAAVLMAALACSFPSIEGREPTPTPANLETLVPLPSEQATEGGEAGEPSGDQVEITVYFTEEDNYAQGIQPYERAVMRSVDADIDLPEAVLEQLFQGPTPQEQLQGLALVNSGFTGFSSLEIRDGVARVYLTGACQSTGATYTIANLLRVNLEQFDDIDAVKIYDENGQTEEPTGTGSSIPFCLEP